MPQWLIAGLLAVGLTGAGWWRLDATTRRTVWAEDGAVFLRERIDLGPVDSILHPYAGYLHLVPRLVTDVAYGLVPLSSYAVAVTVLCCAITGLIGAAVFLCSHDVISSLWARIVLGSLTVLAPSVPVEVLGNAANLHSAFLWLTPWLLLARPERWSLAVLLGLTTLVTALTEVQSLLFVPLILWRVTDRFRWPAIAGLLIGSAAQVGVTLTHPRSAVTAPALDLLDVVKGYLFNVVLPIWHPSVHDAGPGFARFGWGLAVLEFLPFAVVTLLLAWLALRRLVQSVGTEGLRAGAELVLIGTLVAGSVVPLAASLVLNPTLKLAYDSFTVAELSNDAPVRYGVASAIFLLAIPVFAADRLSTASWRWRRPVTLVIAGAMLVVLVSHFFVDGSTRTEGPRWAKEVAAAQRQCQSGGSPRRLRMAPNPAWKILLSCRQLGRR